MKAWVLTMILAVLSASAAQAEAPPDLGAQKEAVRLYPELGKRDSDFNKRFNERLRALRWTKDALMDQPNWPLMIAHQVARDMVAPLPSTPAPVAQTSPATTPAPSTPGTMPAPSAPTSLPGPTATPPVAMAPPSGSDSGRAPDGVPPYMPFRPGSTLWPVPKGPIDPEIIAAAKSEKVRWDSTGHPKAKGVRMTLRYPSTWRAEEGNRPHIVQKFIQTGRTSTNAVITRMVMVQAQELPESIRGKITYADKEALVSREAAGAFVPTEGELISHHVTKLDGEPCAMIELSATSERMGLTLRQRSILFVVPRDTALVLISCGVGGEVSGGNETVDEAYSQVRMLLYSIAISCVFTDKWEDK